MTLVIEASLWFEVLGIQMWLGESEFNSWFIDAHLGKEYGLLFYYILTMNQLWFQGQALAKINIGDVLDSDGNWAGALDAFEEGYRHVLMIPN